ncbi:hypothetical protein BOX15_Mlig010883g4, partial [Macrostomum lignano]
AMRLITPEISWHETTPIYSCDIQQTLNTDSNGANGWYRLATGGRDNRVQLWKLPAAGDAVVEFLSSLRRHEKPVNVVRFSPDQRLLASGSDDATVLLWARQEVQPELPAPSAADEDDLVCKETWTVWRALRAHLEDVYDLGWMPDSMGLVSGSVDRSIVRWNLAKEQQRTIVREHAHFVQGIACDPLGRLVATQSSDRTVRVYGCSARAVVIAKCVRNTEQQQQQQQQQSNNYRLFADDSWKSFFRRLSFSPDGKVLAAPAGLHWNDNYCVHLFGRAKLDKPFASLVTGQSAPVAVRFCQRRFALAYHPQLELGRRRIQQDLVKLPYRWVFAVVLESGVLLCDTQHPFPIGALRNLHYQALNDAAWSADGSQLVLASTDGYCSIVRFGEGELGQPFAEPEKENLDAPQTPLAPPPPPPPTPQSSTKPPQAPPATPPAAAVAASSAAAPAASPGDPLTPRGQKRRVPFVTLATSLDAASAGANSAPGTPTTAAPMTTSVAAAAAPSTVASTSAAGTSDNVDSPLRKKRRVSFFTISSCVGNGGGGGGGSGSGASEGQ